METNKATTQKKTEIIKTCQHNKVNMFVDNGLSGGLIMFWSCRSFLMNNNHRQSTDAPIIFVCSWTQTALGSFWISSDHIPAVGGVVDVLYFTNYRGSGLKCQWLVYFKGCFICIGMSYKATKVRLKSHRWVRQSDFITELYIFQQL